MAIHRVIMGSSFIIAVPHVRAPSLNRVRGRSLVTRRLGQDTGRDILLDVGGQISVIKQTMHEVNKPDSIRWDEDIKAMKSSWA